MDQCGLGCRRVIFLRGKDSGYDMSNGMCVGGDPTASSGGTDPVMIKREQQTVSLEQLPEDCIAAIISHTSQWDACRLACVSSTFAAAVRSDRVWHMLLPSDYARIYPEARELATKREVVKALTEGVLLADGKERYVLSRRWGGVCRLLSAMAMEIVGGNDPRYWRWDYSKSSCFSKVAHLLATRWLNVSGTWKCRLPPATYSVIWRLRFANPLGGCLSFLSWDKPLRFMVSTSNREYVEKELDLGQVQSKFFHEWIEFEVGEIVVRGERMIAQDVELIFMIQELDCSKWKGGLFIDCLALRPTRTQGEPIFTGGARCEAFKRKTMRGVF